MDRRTVLMAGLVTTFGCIIIVTLQSRHHEYINIDVSNHCRRGLETDASSVVGDSHNNEAAASAPITAACATPVLGWYDRQPWKTGVCPGEPLPRYAPATLQQQQQSTTGGNPYFLNTSLIVEIGPGSDPETGKLASLSVMPDGSTKRHTFVLVVALPGVVPALLRGPHPDVIISAAVTPVAGFTVLNTADSVAPRGRVHVRRGAGVTVPSLPLSQVLDAVGRRDEGTKRAIEMLIIDVLGTDLDVAMSAGPHWLQQVKNIIIKCHDGQSGRCANASVALQAAPYYFKFEFCMDGLGWSLMNCWFSRGPRPMRRRQYPRMPHKTSLGYFKRTLRVLQGSQWASTEDNGFPSLYNTWRLLCPVRTRGNIAAHCGLQKITWSDPGDDNAATRLYPFDDANATKAQGDQWLQLRLCTEARRRCAMFLRLFADVSTVDMPAHLSRCETSIPRLCTDYV
jgi:hypothetical protein